MQTTKIVMAALVVAALACNSQPPAIADSTPSGPEAAAEKVRPVQGDWPAFRGADADGIAQGEKIWAQWPQGGPPVQWQAELGSGYSALVVADGRLFTLYGEGGGEFLAAFDAASGKPLWKVKIDAIYRNRFGDGPRSAPLVDGGLVYGVGAQGALVAAQAASGEVVWQGNVVADHGARIPEWGIAATPTLGGPDGGLLLLDIGAPDAAILALDKKTGKKVWGAGQGRAGYSSPVSFTLDGQKQTVFFTADKVLAIDPDEGDVLWEFPWKTSYDINAATPIVVPPNRVFVSSGYDTGAGLLEVTRTDSGWKAEAVWTSRGLKNQFSSSVLLDGTLYGFDNKVLKAVDLATGEERWRQRTEGHGSLIAADGHLIILGEKGRLALAEVNPKEYVEQSAVQILNGKCWTSPTLVDGNLFLRNEGTLLSARVAD
jgi:outer membrane protein assembly factor BamB